MSSDDRKGIVNGVWLCQSCAKLVDSDHPRYSIDLLRRWKQQAEEEQTRRIGSRPELSGVQPSETHSIRFTVNDWKVWRHEGNRPGDVLIFVSPWAGGNIRYSCKIRLRSDLEWEEQLHRQRIEFRKGDLLVHSDEYAFGDEEVTLPPRKWISLDVSHGLHEEAIFAGSESAWFTAETVGDNVKLTWRLTGLGND